VEIGLAGQTCPIRRLRFEADYARGADSTVCFGSPWYEVYVSSFPKPSGRLQVSLAGGRLPAWRNDGKELFYLDPSGNVIAVELTANNGSLQAANHRTLFQIRLTTANDNYDVFPDGKKLLVNTITTEEVPAPLSLIQNWTAELKK